MGVTDRQARLHDKKGGKNCRHASIGMSQGGILMYVRTALSAVPNVRSHTAAAVAAAAATTKTLIKSLFLKCCRCHRPSSVISLY